MAPNVPPKRSSAESAEDQKAITPLLRGRPEDWSIFVRKYGPVLQKAVWFRLRKGGVMGEDLTQLSEDGTQEALARLCRDDFTLLRRFDPEKARLETYLALLASSAAADLLRQWRRWAKTGTGNNSSMGATSLDSLPEGAAHAVAPLATEARAQEERLQELMPGAVLSPRQRLIMTLLYERDMDVVDVARVLNCEPQTVRSQRHKALEKLRSYHKSQATQAAALETGGVL